MKTTWMHRWERRIHVKLRLEPKLKVPSQPARLMGHFRPQQILPQRLV
jgi:hypothetical protein